MDDLAALRANGQGWDAAVRAHAIYQAAPADGSGDAAAAEALNALTVPGAPTPVPVADIVRMLRTRGKWLPIKAAAASNPAAAAAVDLATDPHTGTVDLTLPLVQSLLPGLVAGGFISDQDLADINAMGTPAEPWWRSIGAPAPLNEFDICRARAGA